MTKTTTNKIAELNDRFRKATGSSDPAGISLGRKFLTSGVRALGLEASVAIAERVMAFDSFTADNDPYEEHDFGSVDYEGQRIFWKIDYYDRRKEFLSPDPADPKVTCRVLTIMLSSEY